MMGHQQVEQAALFYADRAAVCVRYTFIIVSPQPLRPDPRPQVVPEHSAVTELSINVS
jgi:hypothetical protein